MVTKPLFIVVHKLHARDETGDACAAEAVVRFFRYGAIVHEETFSGKIDSDYRRPLGEACAGVFDAHGGRCDASITFEYELMR